MVLQLPVDDILQRLAEGGEDGDGLPVLGFCWISTLRDGDDNLHILEGRRILAKDEGLVDDGGDKDSNTVDNLQQDAGDAVVVFQIMAL